MIYSVNLKDDKGKLSFVAGMEDTRDKIRVGLSIFHNEKYVLNFVLLPGEEKLLKSDLEFKSIRDTGHIFIAQPHDFMILKHHYSYSEDVRLSNFIRELDNGLEKAFVEYSEVHFYSKEPNIFSDAIRLAMNNPEMGNNLFYHIPEGSDEIVLNP